MRHLPEPSEAQIKAAQKKQEAFDLYYRVFSTEDGRALLEDFKRRGFYYASTFFDDGRSNQAIRDYREGQRCFVLETLDYVEKGRIGMKPPMAQQARSATAETP
jgi:hypothetical protein